MKDYNMKDYKKILEGVVNIISTTEKSDIGFADICTYIGENCPELKESEESEDERIRKELLNAFQEAEDSLYMVLTPNRRKSFIAWLEKQGEHQKFRDSIQVGDKVTRNKDGILVNLSQLDRVAKKEEKRGEQIDLVNKEYWRGYREGKQEILDKYSELKKQGEKGINGNEREIPNSEQKPADKVEPRFEIGDLITNGVLVGKIDEIHELGYHAYFGDHYADVPDIENWHKWTIEDAKDGDVLYSPSHRLIWIYNDYEHYHASINLNYADVVSFDNEIVVPSDVCPANRVQRSILFQKMEEADYMWDAKNRQLRKIELRQEELTEFEKAVKQVMEEAIECGDTHNLKADANMLLRLVQKPAEWSEIMNINYGALWERLNVLGWSVEKALTTPVRDDGKH